MQHYAVTSESDPIAPSTGPPSSVFVLISSVAALGGLLFGYDWVVIGGARQFFEVYFRLASPALIGWVNSCAIVGCVLGAGTAGWMADRFGRRFVLTTAAALFGISSLLTALAISVPTFVAWRIVGGVAIGLASHVSPTYIAEVSPVHWRGRLVTLNQLAIVIGIVLAQTVNLWIARPEPLASNSWNVVAGWRWMFAVILIPSAIFLLGSRLIPESPRWLRMRGRNQDADRALTRLGVKTTYAYKLETKSSIRLAKTGSLSNRLHKKALLLAMALVFVQQWCGVNIVFSYATDLYAGTEPGSQSILVEIAATGLINFVFTIVALFLVDKIGRRPLVIVGCFGLAVCNAVAALAVSNPGYRFGVLIATFVSVAVYASTLAPITWVVITELFSDSVRGKGVAVASATLWLSSFLVTLAFPLMRAQIKISGTFWVYAAVCAVSGLLLQATLPETAGKALD